MSTSKDNSLEQKKERKINIVNDFSFANIVFRKSHSLFQIVFHEKNMLDPHSGNFREGVVEEQASRPMFVVGECETL